jgi:hypothetical protein
MTAEGQRKGLVVIRPTRSLLGGEGGAETGGQRGTVTAEREARRRRRVRAQGDVAEGGGSERHLRSANGESSVATRFRVPCEEA